MLVSNAIEKFQTKVASNAEMIGVALALVFLGLVTGFAVAYIWFEVFGY